MTINERIRDYLSYRRAKALSDFQSTEPTFNAIRAQLDLIDVKLVEQQFLEEIATNCERRWLEAIEPINAVTSGYDFIYHKNEGAVAYGIIMDECDDLKIQAEPYATGDNYSFAALFEGVPGVTLNVLEPLVPLGSYLSIGAEGFDELNDAYLCTAYMCLHDALAKFVKTNLFDKMPRFTPFHFLIQEHDTGNTQPIYIVE